MRVTTKKNNPVRVDCYGMELGKWYISPNGTMAFVMNNIDGSHILVLEDGLAHPRLKEPEFFRNQLMEEFTGEIKLIV